MSESLLATLRQRGDLAPDAPLPPEAAAESRWVLGLQMVGGWLAAIFLLLFLGAGTAPFIHSAGGWLVIGLILTAFAGFGLRQSSGILLRQFLLVISLVGQIAVIIGIGDSKLGLREYSGMLIAAFEVAVFLAVPWGPHRLIAGSLALLALSTAGFRNMFGHRGSAMLPYVTAYWLLACLLAHTEARWRALRASSMLNMLVAAMLVNVALYCAMALFRPLIFEPGFRGHAEPWGLVLIAGATLLVVGNEIWRGWQALLAGLLLVGALALTWRAPGVAVGLTVMLLGFRRGHGWMLWAGGGLALVAMNRFYYDLQVDLLYKSGLLVGSGILLLAMRALLAGAALREEQSA